MGESKLIGKPTKKQKKQHEANKAAAIKEIQGTKYNADARDAMNLAEYNTALEQQAQRLETSKAALELYGSTIAGVAGELRKLNRETADLIVEEYEFNKAYNEGRKTFKDVKDAYDKWLESVDSGGKKKVSYDVVDKMAELKTSLEDVLGTEVSDDFLKKNRDLIKQLFSGTEKQAEEAYKKLKLASLAEAWTNLGNRILKAAEQAKAAGKTVNVTIGEWQRLQTVISGMKVGATLGAQDLNSLRYYLTQAKMSYEEMQQFLEDNQLEVKTKVKDGAKLKEVKVPKSSITKTYTISGKYNPYTGKKMKKDLTWTETEETGESVYYTLADDVSVEKVESGGGGGTNFTPGGDDGGSDSGELDQAEPLDKEADRYHDVNVELEKISNRLEEIQTKTDRNIGTAWLENLTQQFELLNDEITMTEAKLKIAEGELAELQGILSKEGLKFNEDGSIANYFEIYEKKKQELEAVRTKYNSFTNKDAQDKYKETWDNAQEDFDKFEENMKRIDELITSLIPGLRKDIQDAIDKQTELKIEAFTREINIRLEVADAKRD